jgi:hypothetical protein
MGAFVVTWRELLIVVIAVLAIYVAELVLLLRWSSKRGAASIIGSRLQARSGAEERSTEELAREIGELRKQVQKLQAELDRVRGAKRAAIAETAQTGTTEVLASPYNQAIHLARQGASANDVATGCGISRGEAELIVALYRKLRI